jgi:cell division protein FtsQ
VAKIDGYTSRASALAEDQPLDQFYRPVAAPKPRPERPLPNEGQEEVQEEEAFLRSRRRVPVRKGILPKTRMGRIALAAGSLTSIAVLILIAIAVRNFLDHDPRFRIETSSSIQVLGNSQVTRPELLAVFGSDIGRNLFFVPLSDRRAALENLPWVQHATVMRLLPNQLRVAVVERTPIAFVRTGNDVGLLDANGVILEMPPAMIAAKHYSFPVVTGIESRDPLSTRAARMHIYQRFVAELDAGGEKISEQLSEVDLSDPEDVRAVVPAEGSDILLHLGDQDFLPRFHSYQAHLAEWRQQYPRLASVDLRYDRQVVLEMQKGTTPSEDPKAKAMNEVNTQADTAAAAVAKPARSRAAKRSATKHVVTRARKPIKKKQAETNG